MKLMSLAELELGDEALARDYRRVTSELANCTVRFLSKSALSPEGAKVENTKIGPGNKNEREAVNYYSKLGYKVIRLTHETLTAIGTNVLGNLPDAQELERLLKKALPAADYYKLVIDHEIMRNEQSLNERMPQDYPAACYPPDFLIYKKPFFGKREFKFVEVKGPTDAMHYVQANWFSIVAPREWEYEVFASLNRDVEETLVVPERGRPGLKFLEAHEEKQKEVREWREMQDRNRLIRAELQPILDAMTLQERIEFIKVQEAKLEKALEAVPSKRRKKPKAIKRL